MVKARTMALALASADWCSVFRQIPVLPVVLPVVAATLVVLLWSLHRTGRLSIPRTGVALVICAYLGGVIANTVFPIYLPGSHISPWCRSPTTRLPTRP